MRLERFRLLPQDAFESEHRADRLAAKSVRGVASTMSSQIMLFVLQLFGTVILARLLTPTDYGLVGMVTVVMTFAAMFKTFGLSAATIQRSTISQIQASALFWINVVASVLIAVCVLAASPLVAAFYQEPALTPVTAVLSISLVLNGISVQHDALLRRHMHFGGLAFAAAASQFLGLGVSVYLALLGLRYWSLVCGTLTTAAVSSMFSFFLCPWLPGRIRRGTGVRDMLGFGMNVTGFEFVNYFSRNLDNILIGRFIGAAPLGLYAKAYQLFMLPITQIREPVTQVAMPVLSSLRNDPTRYNKYYRRTTDILATTIVPLAALAFIEAGFLVRVILGPQWMEAVPVFRMLALAGLVQGVASTRGLVLLSMGFPGRYLRWGIANAVVVCASFVAGLPFGVRGVAMAYAIANYAILVPSLYYCFRGTPVSVGQFMGSLIVPAGLSLLAGGAGWMVLQLVGDSTAGNIAAILIFLIVYLGPSGFRPLVRDTIKRIMTELPFGRVSALRGKRTP